MGRARVVAAGVGIAVVAAGGTVVLTQLASAADSNTLTACVKNDSGELRLVAAGTTCAKGEHLVTWSITGPQGVPGPTGSPGAQGPKGDPGGSAPPAVVGFLSVDGIPGDATVAGHEGEIAVSSFSFGATNSSSTASGSGGGTGKATLSNITVVKSTDKASPLLLRSVLTGQHIRSAKLTLCDPVNCAGTTTEVYDLSDLLVVGDAHSTPPGTESLQLDFTKISYTAGGSSVSWDKALQTTG